MTATFTPRKMRQLRDSMGLTQEQFGELLGLTVRTVQRLESGTSPISRLHQLALRQVASEGGIKL